MCWADDLQDRNSQRTLSWMLELFPQFWRLKSGALAWARFWAWFLLAWRQPSPLNSHETVGKQENSTESLFTASSPRKGWECRSEHVSLGWGGTIIMLVKTVLILLFPAK